MKLPFHLKRVKNTFSANMQKIDSHVLDQFSGIVGSRYALTRPEDVAPYVREPRGRYIGSTPMVLRPGSVQEVSKILSLADQLGVAVVPQGGNTGLVAGQIPDETGNQLVLSISRLNHIRAVDADSNLITVEAGVTLEQVQEAAKKVARLFPLDFASRGSCEIGGNIATNAGGLAVLAYGNTRDLVLGLEVVLASGKVWNGLRSLRKDNTGYDLKSLFVGSEGTLGIITAAVLKLFPQPTEQATALVGFNSLDQVQLFFNQIVTGAGSSLTAYEFMPRIGLEFVLRHVPGTRDPFVVPHQWYVLFELTGHTTDDRMIGLIESLLDRATNAGVADDAIIAASMEQRKDLWRIRETLAETLDREGGSIKHDIAVPVRSIPDFIEQANKLVEQLIPGIRPVPFGHYGDGNVHYNLTQPVEADRSNYIAQWDRVNEAVHGLVLKFGGSISAEHGIGRMKRSELAKVKSDIEMELMRGIKRLLDPRGILNPGEII